MMKYPVFSPFLDDREVQACKAALDSKYLGMGSFVGEFEKKLASFMALGEDEHVMACSTGHAALHMALMLLEVGPGDEVITPSFNNIADFQAISAVGAEAVFCDVKEDDLCVDPETIPPLITDKTKAIIILDYGAQLADHAAIAKISEHYNIPVIHDAAHSFGSHYQGKHVGRQHQMTMLSFDPIKNITCIDGGALIVKGEQYVTPFREMRLIGMSQDIAHNYNNRRDWKYDTHRLGFRYHMANLHAAIGLTQMEKFEDIRQRRCRLYELYYERLNDHPLISLQGELQEGVVPFILCMRVARECRDELIAHLNTHSIEGGFHWTPGHQFSMFSGCRSGDLSVTDKIAEEIISLPFFPDLSEEDVHFVCDRILEHLETVAIAA